MRALRPMTQEERDFAEQKHDLVIQFLHCKCLPMDDYYDITFEKKARKDGSSVLK